MSSPSFYPFSCLNSGSIEKADCSSFSMMDLLQSASITHVYCGSESMWLSWWTIYSACCYDIQTLETQLDFVYVGQ